VVQGYVLTSILDEKEKKITNGMRMMGLSSGVMWASWFATALLKLMVFSLLATLLLVYGGALPRSSLTELWVLFLAFGCVANVRRRGGCCARLYPHAW
jgi:hypothetical protein